MLILTRKPGTAIVIGKDVIVTVLETRRDGAVRIGVDCPKPIPIWRSEIYQKIQANKAAGKSEGVQP